MTRLTDEELDAISEQCGSLGLVALNAAAQRDVQAMIAEIRERRAADLTPEDVEALKRLFKDIRTWALVRHHFENNHRHALAVLDRLLEREGRGR